MTVSTTINRTNQNGNGSTTTIPINFGFHNPADLKVLLVVIATDVSTLQTLTTHYTIGGTPDALGNYSGGGSVNMIIPPSTLQRVVVYRDPARTQGMDLVENGSLPAESTEAAIDYQTMLIQRVADQIGRSIRQPDEDSANLATMPTKVDRASLYLGFNAAGDPIALAAPAGTTAVSSFMATVLDDTTALGARATLEAAEIEPTDLAFRLRGSSDQSKKLAFEVDGFTAGQTRTITPPDRSITLSMTHGTEQATTSGSSKDFTGIPSGVRRVYVFFNEVSTTGVSALRMLLGDAGGFEGTGYAGTVGNSVGAGLWSTSTGIDLQTASVAAGLWTGVVTLVLMNVTTNTWFVDGVLARTDTASMFTITGRKALSDTLTQLRITTVGGSDTFDAGAINIAYEF